jgi:hypothetical protein
VHLATRGMTNVPALLSIYEASGTAQERVMLKAKPMVQSVKLPATATHYNNSFGDIDY